MEPECVELIRLGLDCLDGSKTVVQLEFRSESVGCGGGELHKSSTLPKQREKCGSGTLGMCRLSKLFLLLVVVFQVESVKVSEVSWSIGSISFIETSGIDMCSCRWTSDSVFMGIIVSFLNRGGIIGIIVSLLHVDIGCCLMNIGEW